MRPLRIHWRWLLWLAAPLTAGIGLGVLFEHWRCRAGGGTGSRQEALLAELVSQLSQLELELRQLRLRRRRSSQRYRSSGGDSSSDEFFDAESDAAAAATGSGSIVNVSAVRLSLLEPPAMTELPEELLERVDSLLAGCEGDDGHREAHNLLRDCLKRERGLATQPAVLLRWAKACLCLHFNEGSGTSAVDLLGQADAAATQALELDTGSAECHAVRARTLGLVIRNKGVKEKVTGGIKFRQLVDRGLELQPDHPDLLELKACFLYEVSKVGWLERRTAAYLFGPDCLPDAKLADAQQLIDKAVALRPSSLTALYWAARCRLEAVGDAADLPEAVRLLRLALKAPVNGAEDRRLRAESAKLLEAYKA